MCLIPTADPREIGLSPAAVHQVGRLRVRAARQGGRLPHGDASPVPRSGTSRGPTRTTPWTGSPTSTSATASSRRCCTRRTSAVAGWCARASTTRSSTSSRCSTPPSSCGTRRSRTCCAGPRRCTATSARSSPRSARPRSSSPTRSSQADPDAFPPVRRKKPPRKGKDGTEIPGRLASWSPPAWRRSGSCGRPATWPREFPEAEIPAMDAKWYRLARYDSAIVSMPDGTVGGALPARPGEVPRPAQADARDPPAAAP